MRGLGEFQEQQMSTDRNAEIYALATAKDHLTYEEIGAKFGLTRQRVSRIVQQERARRR
jgi:DNA-binding transcriptional regulator LsrR (DeoR family)